MITYLTSSIFTSPAQVLVNTVNTMGVMGKGLAKEFRQIFPEMFAVYQDECRRGAIEIGTLQLYRTPHKWILNFPTKRHFRYPSRLEYVEAGLQLFSSRFVEDGLTSVAFPQLGCGTGGLDWERQVRPLMEDYLGGLPIDAYVHVVDGVAGMQAGWDAARLTAWLRGEPRLLSFAEFWRAVVDVAVSFHDEKELGIDEQHWFPVRGDRGEVVALTRRTDDSGHISMSEEQVRDLWQQLESFGLLTIADLPVQHASAGRWFLDLLARLPYITWTRWTMDYAKLQAQESLGVQYLPEVDAAEPLSQPSLFGEREAWRWRESPMPTR